MTFTCCACDVGTIPATYSLAFIASRSCVGPIMRMPASNRTRPSDQLGPQGHVLVRPLSPSPCTAMEGCQPFRSLSSWWTRRVLPPGPEQLKLEHQAAAEGRIRRLLSLCNPAKKRPQLHTGHCAFQTISPLRDHSHIARLVAPRIDDTVQGCTIRPRAIEL